MPKKTDWEENKGGCVSRKKHVKENSPLEEDCVKGVTPVYVLIDTVRPQVTLSKCILK